MNDNKIIEFSTAQKNYLRLANKKAEQGDAVASLGFLLSALKNEYSVSILSSIANTYSDMGLVSLSNLYWFKYLSIYSKPFSMDKPTVLVLSTNLGGKNKVVITSSYKLL